MPKKKITQKTIKITSSNKGPAKVKYGTDKTNVTKAKRIAKKLVKLHKKAYPKKKSKKTLSKNQEQLKKQNRRLKNMLSRLLREGYEIDESKARAYIEEATTLDRRATKKRIEAASKIGSKELKEFAANKAAMEELALKKKQEAAQKAREARAKKIQERRERFEKDVQEDKEIALTFAAIEQLAEQHPDANITILPEDIANEAEVYMANFNEIYQRKALKEVGLEEVRHLQLFIENYELAKRIYEEKFEPNGSYYFSSWIRGAEWINENVQKYGAPAVAKALAIGYEAGYWKDEHDFYSNADRCDEMLKHLNESMMNVAPQFAMTAEQKTQIMDTERNLEVASEYQVSGKRAIKDKTVSHPDIFKEWAQEQMSDFADLTIRQQAKKDIKGSELVSQVRKDMKEKARYKTEYN